MAYRSDIDELLNYSYKTRGMVLQNQQIMALIANDPNYDPEGDDVEQYEQQVKDHDYVDETSLTANAYVIIETEMHDRSSHTMKTMRLYVSVICSKKYMDLDPKLFRGYKGNRRDNIARLVNNLLQDSDEFGIGELHLISATIGSVPTGFTCRVLTYEVPSFAAYDHI